MSEQYILELRAHYSDLAAQGLDLHGYRISTLSAIHYSLSSNYSKTYRSIRGAAAGLVPVIGGVGHTTLTGKSHAKKCVLAYGLAGSTGNSVVVKEVAEEIVMGVGINAIIEAAFDSVIPGVGSVLAARSAYKVMDEVLNAVHKRADELHMAAINHVHFDTNWSPPKKDETLMV
ncbi:hypothetical protein BGX24_000760 [Mortierella sp. AD032]|nr:hypothetical protein BGX24_000760 [Mortierella sp. AD032]